MAAETLPLLVLFVSLEASTATAGAVCVGGSPPTEVMELAKLMEVMVADLAAETLTLLVLFVSVEASTATAGAVCVGAGDRRR